MNYRRQNSGASVINWKVHTRVPYKRIVCISVRLISLLMDMGKKKTKYNVLNLNSKFTVDQKQTLEHVFDALYAKYTNAKANDIIQTIIDSF